MTQSGHIRLRIISEVLVLLCVAALIGLVPLLTFMLFGS